MLVRASPAFYFCLPCISIVQPANVTQTIIVGQPIVAQRGIPRDHTVTGLTMIYQDSNAVNESFCDVI